MSKYMTDINPGQLLGELQNAAMIEPNAFTQLGQFIQPQQQEEELPLYLRILVGISAFIASLCFIGFLSVSKIISFNSEAGLIFWGLIFVGGAFFLAKTSGNKDNTVKHSFLIQSSRYGRG